MNETYEQKRIKSLEAMLDTEREMARAEHQSSLNLVRFCGDESAWSLPMRGNDLVVRDCIRAFRARLAEAEAIVARLERTADGKPMVRGDIVYVIADEGIYDDNDELVTRVIECKYCDPTDPEYGAWPYESTGAEVVEDSFVVMSVWSTRHAAEQAAAKEGR